MAKRKTAASRRGKSSPVLRKLQPAESQEVLEALLKAHPKLRRQAEEIARSLISDVCFDDIAGQVEWEIEHLDLEDLNSRAGNHGSGYVDPGEAAWELLHEAIDPIIADMDRQLELGLWRQALETCKGLVLGLYAVRNTHNDGCLGWAPDFAEQTAEEILEKWRGRGKAKRRSFPRSFVDEHVPEWKALVDRVLSG